MAIISDTGIESTSLNEYQSLLETAFQNSLGADLDLDPQTPQGQIIGILALNFSNLDDEIVQLFNGLNIFVAPGNLLDVYGNLFGITRKSATSSEVTATVTGVNSTIIPAGSRARTTNGDLFESLDDITITGGSSTGIFISVETGPIPIDINTLTQIVDVTTGWETIDNLVAGTIGTDQETDNAYRTDYFNQIAQNANGTVESIRSNIESLDNVIDSKVFENDTDSNIIIQNITLLPHSIAVIVSGGESQDIGNTIYLTKTAGANTESGTGGIQTAVTVPTNDGTSSTIIYYYPVEFVTVAIFISITLYPNTESGNIINLIKQRILEYFDGTFNAGVNQDGLAQFDTSGIGIAEFLVASRLYTPVNSVTGFEITSLSQEISGSGNPQDVIEPNLNQQLVTDETNIIITIN